MHQHRSLPPRARFLQVLYSLEGRFSRYSHHRRSTLNVDFYFHACVRLILHKLFFSNRAVVFSFQRTQDKVCRVGADRDRTDGLRLAKPALSQLSYSPGG